MRMLVTGREGQVARSLAERASSSNIDLVTLGRPELDLAGDAYDIVTALKAARPEIIVSAAAYTAVDRAESEPERAFAVNERGPKAIASAAAELRVPLIHLSTDYVFDGTKASPYDEEDATGPTGVYGASKLAGEQAVLAGHADSVVLRTAWVYSPFGANFVKTMLRLAGERGEVGVVGDQQGNPTSALDIADGIIAVAWNLLADDDTALRGIFHCAGMGEASWAEFAEGIFAASSGRGGPTARVRHIRTADYPTSARRPANSRMDCSKLARVHGVKLPDWHDSVGNVVGRLLAR